jgi:hypothetical protein
MGLSGSTLRLATVIQASLFTRIYSMENSLSRECDSRTRRQEILRILWETKFHYSIHKIIHYT